MFVRTFVGLGYGGIDDLCTTSQSGKLDISHQQSINKQWFCLLHTVKASRCLPVFSINHKIYSNQVTTNAHIHTLHPTNVAPRLRVTVTFPIALHSVSNHHHLPQV